MTLVADQPQLLQLLRLQHHLQFLLIFFCSSGCVWYHIQSEMLSAE
jgi:hypothetical protein